MTYTCKGCSKVISVDTLVDQRFSVAVCLAILATLGRLR